MNTQIVMTAAWTIARQAAAKFGGNAKQYIGGSLKAAWNLARKPMTQKEIVKVLDAAASKAPSRKMATARQTWYLAGLMAAKWDKAVGLLGKLMIYGSLHSDRASDLIAEYK